MDENKTLLTEETSETVSAVETSEATQEQTVTTAPAAEEAPAEAAPEPSEVTPTESEAQPDQSAAAPQQPEEASAETEEAPEAEAPALPDTKAAVVARLKEIADNEEQVERATLESLKQVFYRLHNAEVAAQRAAFIEAGGSEEEFVPQPDQDEEAFKSEMNRVKEQRAKIAEQQGEAQRLRSDRRSFRTVRVCVLIGF